MQGPGASRVAWRSGTASSVSLRKIRFNYHLIAHAYYWHMQLCSRIVYNLGLERRE